MKLVTTPTRPVTVATPNTQQTAAAARAAEAQLVVVAMGDAKRRPALLAQLASEGASVLKPGSLAKPMVLADTIAAALCKGMCYKEIAPVAASVTGCAFVQVAWRRISTRSMPVLMASRMATRPTSTAAAVCALAAAAERPAW